ncbi:MAG: YggT family protein [Alphaproteobacteria bacterium]|nr:YggT family protein [Alphaproteobacteria bacterium]
MHPIIEVLLIVIDLYMWAVIIGVVLSWLVAFHVVNRHNQFVYTVGDFLGRITAPALRPIRRILPSFGGVDLAPLALLLLLYLVKRLIVYYS